MLEHIFKTPEQLHKIDIANARSSAKDDRWKQLVKVYRADNLTPKGTGLRPEPRSVPPLKTQAKTKELKKDHLRHKINVLMLNGYSPEEVLEKLQGEFPELTLKTIINQL